MPDFLRDTSSPSWLKTITTKDTKAHEGNL